MSQRIYQWLLHVAQPLVRARLWWRGRKEPEYNERVEERFGQLPANAPRGVIWFHAVSAGESIAAVPLVETVLEEFPEQPVLVTTMTPTGAGEVRKRLGDRVTHLYAPYDFKTGVQSYFDRVQPSILVLLETELWPNMIATAQARGVPVLVVNARLSERSLKGYRRISTLAEFMLQRLSLIACQSEAHRRRFIQLGAPAERVQVFGSVKFDVELTDAHRAQAAEFVERWQLADRPVWLAGSTHPGEEEVVLRTHKRLLRQFPQACLVLVPRHPVRVEEVMKLVAAESFSGALQSGRPQRGAHVIVGDVMGSLLWLYGVSQAAFVGGSLVPHGGHNPIEAALWQQAVLMGNHVHNFEDVAQHFKHAGNLKQVADEAELERQLGLLFKDPVERELRGKSGRQVVAQQRGALARYTALLRREVGAAIAARR